MDKTGKEADPASTAYWEEYYKANPHPFNPSAFALEVARWLGTSGTMIELGCGNGRDAVFLSQRIQGTLLAIDQCVHEVERLNLEQAHERLHFLAADFSTYRPTDPIQYAYSRWTMHAIDEEAEDRTLDWLTRSVRNTGIFFVEARSVRDDLYGKGEHVGGHAYLTDHYRRFMDPEVFTQKLRTRGWTILDSVESRGFAVHQDDDPVIVRVIAQKP